MDLVAVQPEFPIAPPHIGQQITAWGVVRHDGLHNCTIGGSCLR